MDEVLRSKMQIPIFGVLKSEQHRETLADTVGVNLHLTNGMTGFKSINRTEPLQTLRPVTR